MSQYQVGQTVVVNDEKCVIEAPPRDKNGAVVYSVCSADRRRSFDAAEANIRLPDPPRPRRNSKN